MALQHKLLFILHDRPNYPSGPIINYLRLLPLLVKNNYVVHLLAVYHNDYPNARKLSKEGVIIHSIEYNYTEPLVKWILLKAEEIQPDIFIPDVSTQGCFAGKWLMKAGIPVINTQRSPDELNTGKAIYFSDPKYGQVLTGLVSVNHFLVKQLFDKVGQSPILTKVIPSGVSVSSAYANMDGDTLKVVYAGRLVENAKRISLLLKAFLKVCSMNNDVTFTIIGDGPEKKNCIDAITSSSYSSNFRFVGKLDGDEYKNELASHQVIVLLSDFEGTPGAMLDGMSCGLIPVCLRYPGIEEIIESEVNGLVVNNREESFQAAIELLYKSKSLRETLSMAAKQTIIDKFTIEIAAKKWIRFFEDCRELSGSRSHFKAPSRITLPPHNKLLLEDRRLPIRSISSRIKSMVPFYRIVRKLIR